MPQSPKTSQNKSYNISQGKKGEAIAIEYLQSQGYTIIERNVYNNHGEIDIVALDHGTLVFVEVKARISDEYGEPLEAITYKKIKTITKAAYYYKLRHPNLPEQMRIDAIAVRLDKQSTGDRIELIKNITW